MAAADEAIERKFERKLSPREMLEKILPMKEIIGCHFCGAHSPTIVVGGFDLCEECKEYY
jgi:hypothetical protein